MFGCSKGCRRETGVEENGRRAKRGMCELSICMNPPLFMPTATCSATSNSYHRTDEPMITYTGAEHRGRVLVWYRSEDGHKNERQPAKSAKSGLRKSMGARPDGRGRVMSRVSRRVDVSALLFTLYLRIESNPTRFLLLLCLLWLLAGKNSLVWTASVRSSCKICLYICL